MTDYLDLEQMKVEEIQPGDKVNVWGSTYLTVESIKWDRTNSHVYLMFPKRNERRYCFGKVLLVERKG